MSPLLPDTCFERIISILQGRRVGLIEPPGNIGDQLIHAASHQLFRRHGIDSVSLNPATLDTSPAEIDVLCWGGGGNVAGRYRLGRLVQRAAEFATSRRIPFVVLPQSIERYESYLKLAAVVFTRELVSHTLAMTSSARAFLAPDLALSHPMMDSTFPGPSREVGVFLRSDKEAAGPSIGTVDPTHISTDLNEYFSLAATCQTIVTDRLHFAIAGLLLRRAVVLVSNAYHKNVSMHATWLRHLGCGFLDYQQVSGKTIAQLSLGRHAFNN